MRSRSVLALTVWASLSVLSAAAPTPDPPLGTGAVVAPVAGVAGAVSAGVATVPAVVPAKQDVDNNLNPQKFSQSSANRRQSHYADVYDELEDSEKGDHNDAPTDTSVHSGSTDDTGFISDISDHDIPAKTPELKPLSIQEASEYNSLLKQQKALPAGSTINPQLADLQARKDAMLNPATENWITPSEAKEYQHFCDVKRKFPTIFDTKYPKMASEWQAMTKKMQEANFEQLDKLSRYRTRFGQWDAKKKMFSMDPDGAGSTAAKWMEEAQKQDVVLDGMFAAWYKVTSGKTISGKALNDVRREAWTDEIQEIQSKNEIARKAEVAAKAKVEAAAKKAAADKAASIQKANDDLLNQISSGSTDPVEPSSLVNLLDGPVDTTITNQFSRAQKVLAQNWAKAQEGTILDQLKALDLDNAATDPDVMKQVQTLLDRAGKLRDLGSGVSMDIAKVFSGTKDSTQLLAALRNTFPELTLLNPAVKQADGTFKSLFGDLEDIHGF